MCYSTLIIRRDIERKDFFLFLVMNYTCWVRRVGSARQSLSRAFLMFINAGAFRLFSLRLNFSSFFFTPLGIFSHNWFRYIVMGLRRGDIGAMADITYRSVSLTVVLL